MKLHMFFLGEQSLSGKCKRVDASDLMARGTIAKASCRAVTNLFKGCRKSIWTLFSAGRRKCKSRIGNGKKERSKRKKHNWKSEGNAILVRGTLCV